MPKKFSKRCGRRSTSALSRVVTSAFRKPKRRRFASGRLRGIPRRSRWTPPSAMRMRSVAPSCISSAGAPKRPRICAKPSRWGLVTRNCIPRCRCRSQGEEKREILRTGMGLINRSSEETGWFYDHLYSMVIRSYWYEGNVGENARLLEEWVPQLERTEHMYRMALQDLGMANSALGKHAEAEAAYRAALAATPAAEKQHVADMV